MASRPRNKLMQAAREEVERNRSAASLDADPIAVLQEILDGRVADLRYAQTRVDELTEDELVERTAYGDQPHFWIRLRDRYRDELERQTNNMVRVGVADRAVRVQEAQAALMVAAVRDAALDAGLTGDQVRALGAALRRRVEEQRTVVEIEPGEPEA